jgi:hypothetical protein
MNLLYVHKFLLSVLTMQPRTTNLMSHRVLPGGVFAYSFPVQATCYEECETCRCKYSRKTRQMIYFVINKLVRSKKSSHGKLLSLNEIVSPPVRAVGLKTRFSKAMFMLLRWAQSGGRWPNYLKSPSTRVDRHLLSCADPLTVAVIFIEQLSTVISNLGCGHHCRLLGC